MFCWLLARCRIPRACHAKRHPNIQKSSGPFSFFHFWLRNVLRATTSCTFSASQFPKVLRGWSVLYILTSKCALRHNGVHFLNIWTSKSALNVVSFVHFDFQMCFTPKRRTLVEHLSFQTCFVPQRRALFQHLNFQSAPNPSVFYTFDFEMCFAPQWRFRQLNFQKCSEREVLLTFSLANVLRATTVRNFSSLIWPNGSAPTALASLLFDPPGPQIIGKTRWTALFYLFAHLHLLSSDSFSSRIFFLLLFSPLTLPTSAFPSVHVVGSLTSKLPSINHCCL